MMTNTQYPLKTNVWENVNRVDDYMHMIEDGRQSGSVGMDWYHLSLKAAPQTFDPMAPPGLAALRPSERLD